ncbi:replication initiator protein A [uncultured Trichococcus sp.]|uniref:replication initiator protein A n=1 Tax=uncultured Trichococcus sp. TaxID=189665 RepID=UPI0037490A35
MPLLLDRLQLSIKNKWIDSSDSLYFVYTNQTLSEILNVSPRKITNIKKELMDTNLLIQEQKKFNAPFRLYLMKPEITVDDIYQINQAETGEDILAVSKDPEFVNTKSPSVANSARLEKAPSNQGPKQCSRICYTEKNSTKSTFSQCSRIC